MIAATARFSSQSCRLAAMRADMGAKSAGVRGIETGETIETGAALILRDRPTERWLGYSRDAG